MTILGRVMMIRELKDKRIERKKKVSHFVYIFIDLRYIQKSLALSFPTFPFFHTPAENVHGCRRDQ